MKSLGKSLVFLIVFIIGQQLFRVIGTMAIYLLNGNNPEVIDIAEKSSMIISAFAGLAIVTVLFFIKKKDKMFMESVKLRSISLKDIGIIIAVFSAFVFVVFAILGLVIKEGSSYTVVNNFIENGIASILGAISIIVIVPIAEEVFFRGIIFNELKTEMSIKAALVVQAAFFGMAHLNIIQAAYTFVLGLLLGVVYLKTRTLTSSILGHILANLMGTIGFRYLGGIVSDSVLNGLIVISVIILAVGGRYFLKEIRDISIEV